LVNFNVVIKRVLYLTEHLDDLPIKQIDPVKKAQFFGANFNKLPTYTDLRTGTLENNNFTGLNSLFLLLKSHKVLMVTLSYSVYKEIVTEVIRWNGSLLTNLTSYQT
jgi:hypothetical protein